MQHNDGLGWGFRGSGRGTLSCFGDGSGSLVSDIGSGQGGAYSHGWGFGGSYIDTPTLGSGVGAGTASARGVNVPPEATGSGAGYARHRGTEFCTGP